MALHPAEAPNDTAARRLGAPASRLMVLLFSDIVGSTELKGRLGTVEYADLLSRHDRVFREIVDSTPGASILKDTGDGFFASFATASDAVRAALRFQHELHRNLAPLKARVGLHLGEVAELEIESSGLPKVVGLATDFAARLMMLAYGGQILMTRVTFNDARQFVRAHPEVPDEPPPELRWVAHGEYLFKGSDEPVEVFEVGAVGVAPLTPPADTEKAHRNVRPGDEDTLGWRPAGGLALRGRPNWIIREKVGEGGFGEVWLAEHAKTGTRRVFKFCFEPHRLRGLKREVVLFRLLKEALGERRDIARIVDFQFDESPYFIETEYFPGGTIEDWVRSKGGLENVPLDARVRIIARVAEALSAAHSVGVLHKDLKPSNILMREDGDGMAYPVITDFGIGILTDRSLLEKHDITVAGFTQSAVTEHESSRTGTRVYAPPESLLNRPFTVQGDVYALGVLLYQMVVGDLTKPLAEGWERDVADELLREDIAACVEGDPSRRLKSAAELATRLHHWRERREQRRRDAEAAQYAARRQRLVRVMATLLIIAIGVTAALTVTLLERNKRLLAERTTADTERRLRADAESARADAEAARDHAHQEAARADVARREAEAERDRANSEMAKAAREAEKAAAVTQFLQDMLGSADPHRTSDRELTVREVLDRAAQRVDHEMKLPPDVEAAIRASIGGTYLTLGHYPSAEQNLGRAVELARESGTLEDPRSLRTYSDLGALYLYRAQYDQAEKVFAEALALRRNILGEEHADTADSLYNLSLVYGQTRQFEKSDEFGRKALAIRENVFGPESKEVAQSLQYLAYFKHQSRQFADAEPLYVRSLELRERTLGPDHFEVGSSHNNLGVFYMETGRLDEAEAHFRKALANMEKSLGPAHPNVAMALTNLGNISVRRERYPEALEWLERAMKITEQTKGPDHPDMIVSLYGIATVHYGMQNYQAAAAEYERALALSLRAAGPDAPGTNALRSALGFVYRDDGQYDKAEPLLREAILGLRNSGMEEQAMLTEVGLVESMIWAGKFEEVEPLALALHERTRSHPDQSMRDRLTPSSLQLLVRLYDDWGKVEQGEHWRQVLVATSQPASTKPTDAGP